MKAEENGTMIDLHTHSTKSDGTLTPKELVRLAKELGLEAIALTDHDTVSGLEEAQEEGARIGVEAAPGIELSTNHEGMEVHILGYYINRRNTEFMHKLREFVEERERRNQKMAKLLQQEGFGVTMEDLWQEYPKSIITRAHFARYLVDHGFVKDRDTVFQEYLGEGCRCYVPRKKITPFEAISLIRLGEGVPFFAHPVLCRMADEALYSFTKQLKEAGLAGIEAIYSMNEPEDERKLCQMAEKLGLLISGGSDFHGKNKSHIQLGAGRGGLQVPYQYLEDIKKWRRAHIKPQASRD